VLRDRDAIYGGDLAAMTRDMGIEEVITAPEATRRLSRRSTDMNTYRMGLKVGNQRQELMSIVKRFE
jgi:hypothetical protein